VGVPADLALRGRCDRGGGWNRVGPLIPLCARRRRAALSEEPLDESRGSAGDRDNVIPEAHHQRETKSEGDAQAPELHPEIHRVRVSLQGSGVLPDVFLEIGHRRVQHDALLASDARLDADGFDDGAELVVDRLHFDAQFGKARREQVVEDIVVGGHSGVRAPRARQRAR